jgi:hypothetical protein
MLEGQPMITLEGASVPNGVVQLLREIFQTWDRRHERRAAREAGHLTFWRDGTLRSLKEIADGKATKATFAELDTAFTESEKTVEDIMERLLKLRDRIGQGQVPWLLDGILHSEVSGKATIREQIELLIERANFDTLMGQLYIHLEDDDEWNEKNKDARRCQISKY